MSTPFLLQMNLHAVWIIFMQNYVPNPNLCKNVKKGYSIPMSYPHPTTNLISLCGYCEETFALPDPHSSSIIKDSDHILSFDLSALVPTIYDSLPIYPDFTPYSTLASSNPILTLPNSIPTHSPNLSNLMIPLPR
ncbi:hypothetical protein H0H87_006769 [Tephrocybe sp. NHM501043]|nr:hypothetical protein H0H87_006769 [Tephrocybe sp. NHM501043]